MSEVDKNEVARGLAIAAAVGEAIRELGEAPAGALYAALMGKMSLESFETVIRALVGSGLVKRRRDHMLIWIGPKEVGRG